MLRRAFSVCAALGVCLYIALASDEYDFKGGAGWYIVPETGVRAPKEVEVAEGGTARVAVRLAERPAAEVTVTAALEGEGFALANEALVFGPENFDQPQTVEVSAPQDDDAADGSATLVLTRAGATAPLRVPVYAADDEPSDYPDLTFEVKDTAGYGVKDHPVTAVIPLEYGRFQSTRRFRILDAAGKPVPAQFDVLTRHWARDRSLRHVAARFEATVGAEERTRFTFSARGGAAPAGRHRVSLTRSDDAIVVDTGVFRFRVNTKAFNLIDEAHLDLDGDGEYADAERILAPGASEGAIFTGRLKDDVQRARERTDLEVRVEESGPMRAVVRLSSLGWFRGKHDHQHGFAVRLYAYAGKSYVKVDYQLQNSAKNVKLSWPLYFEDVSLHIKPSLDNPTVRLSPRFRQVWKGEVGAGKVLLQNSHAEATVHDAGGDVLVRETIKGGQSSFGWADLSDDRRGVTAIVRHMAEMWPNALEVGRGNDFYVRLWPKQSCQMVKGRFTETGLHWLEDMQHVVKETLLYFHGPGATDLELETLAANLGYGPVASIPLEEYRRTQVTSDLDGIIPSKVKGGSRRGGNRPGYEREQLDPGHEDYNFGWMNFGGNTSRRYTATTGGYPRTGHHFLVSGHPRHYFEAERRMWGDLNVRPQWIAGYVHDRDFGTVQPTVNPYAGTSWRIYGGKGSKTQRYPHLPGTEFLEWRPRDNQHGWFYHIEDYYYFSGNPWVRDWYEFIAEFRKRSLLRHPKLAKHSDNPYDLAEWNFSTRGDGHLLANSWQAYRLTGDAQLLHGLKNRLDWLMQSRWQRQYGHVSRNKEESAFQMGYLCRGVINYFAELRGHHPEHEQKAYMFLWGLMDWHYHYNQFQNFVETEKERPLRKSSGTALTMVDPSLYWYRISGQKKHLDLTLEYVSKGLRRGRKPYGNWGAWEGDFMARVYWHEVPAPKQFGPKPPAVTDLTATPAGKARVRLEWTAPEHAARYLVVWSHLPISGEHTNDRRKRNFWAAEVIPQAIAARPGERESLELQVGPGRIYVALVTFASDGHMSDLSNTPEVTVR